MSKTRAAGNPLWTRPEGSSFTGSPSVGRADGTVDCSILVHGAVWRPQAFAWAVGLLLVLLSAAARACPGPAWPIDAIAPDVWLARAAEGEATPDNRGRVANLLVVRSQRRVWLLGSGPSPASARSLACQLRRDLGLEVTDVVAPWARPELVLGHRAWPGARRWAHADVRRAMQAQCAQCVERLRARLGPTAADLGEGDPVLLPSRLLTGDHGELGPLRWWRLRRSGDHSVTLWRLRRAPLWVAQGLLWGDGPPDARDADVAMQADSTDRLLWLAQLDGPAARWVPEQGGLLDTPAVAAQAAYWRRLSEAAREAALRGEVEGTPPPPGLAGLVAWETHPRHAMNWQRVMRQITDAMLDNGPR